MRAVVTSAFRATDLVRKAGCAAGEKADEVAKRRAKIVAVNFMVD